MNANLTSIERIEALKDRRVFITGNTGFTGSWLSLWLYLLGAKVVGYALDAPTKPNLFETLNLRRKILSIHGSVLDFNSLNHAIKKHEPEIIFHLAAMPIVRESYKYPRLTYETNVMGAVNLLECVRSSNSVRSVVIVTSEKCYKIDTCRESFSEDAPIGEHDPYSSSKACVEILTNSWAFSFFSTTGKNTQRIGTGTARPSNIIGGGDWSVDRLIPDCIKACNAGSPIFVRNPMHHRPWQYVFNPLYGYLLLASFLLDDPVAFSSGFNFGAPRKDLWSVESVVKKIIQTWGNGEYQVDKNNNHPYEEKSLFMECNKAKSMLNWEPLFDLTEGIAETVSWYRNFYNCSSNKKIEKYSQLCIEAAMVRILSHSERFRSPILRQHCQLGLSE